MATEREQLYTETITNAFRIAGVDEAGIERASILSMVSSFLPLWDEIMPLLVSDIVKAVKKELHHG